MQNKPNLPDVQMDVTSISTKAYENKPRLRTPPKQTQFYLAEALAKADKPKQTQFQKTGLGSKLKVWEKNFQLSFRVFLR